MNNLWFDFSFLQDAYALCRVLKKRIDIPKTSRRRDDDDDDDYKGGLIIAGSSSMEYSFDYSSSSTGNNVLDKNIYKEVLGRRVIVEEEKEDEEKNYNYNQKEFTKFPRNTSTSEITQGTTSMKDNRILLDDGDHQYHNNNVTFNNDNEANSSTTTNINPNMVGDFSNKQQQQQQPNIDDEVWFVFYFNQISENKLIILFE